MPAVLGPNEKVARDDGHDAEEDGEDREGRPFVAARELAVDRLIDLGRQARIHLDQVACKFDLDNAVCDFSSIFGGEQLDVIVCKRLFCFSLFSA